MVIEPPRKGGPSQLSDNAVSPEEINILIRNLLAITVEFLPVKSGKASNVVESQSAFNLAGHDIRDFTFLAYFSNA